MRKVLQEILFISAVTFIFISCEKGEEPFPTSVNTEKTLVQLPDAANGPLITVALDLTPGAQTVNILTLQRNATSAAELHKPLTVKVKLQNAVISDPSSGEVHELPRNLYTNHPDNPFDGQYWTVTFPADEPITYLKIILDASNLITLTQRVGLGFQLAEAPGAQISDSKNQLGVEIGAKNQFDGVYRVRYRLFHPTNVDITGIGTIPEWDFLTSGPRSIDWDVATVFINFATNGLTYFGDASGPSLQIRMTVNSDNTVSLTNVGSRAVALSFPPLVVPAGVTNRYDPATKTIYAAYTWTPAGAGTREKYDTITYIRPR